MITSNDYDKVVRRPAVLASRLLDNPQALHYFYAMYFGRNFEMPCGDHQRYVSDKGTNDLTLDDIKATRKQLALLVDRVRFEFIEMISEWGKTCSRKRISGERGRGSVIQLSTRRYSAAQNKTREDAHNAQIDLLLATTMLHELAHAAQNDVVGGNLEDCFEDSFVAEAGFEFESRLFGLIWLESTDLLLPSYDRLETLWLHWQTSWLCEDGNDIPDLCCDPSKLDERRIYRDIDSNFVLRLFDSGFWDGEYARRGGVALLPPPVIDICQQRCSGMATAYMALPTSVKQLWMASEGIAYPRVELPHLAN